MSFRTFCSIFLFLSPNALVLTGSTVQSAEDLLTVKTRSSRIIAKQADPLWMPSDVAVGANGALYVVDGVRHRIVVFDSQGTPQLTFGGLGNAAGKFSSPLGVGASAEGTIYVADTGNRRIQAFDAKGNFLREISVPSRGAEKPPDITDVAIDSQQNRLYLADNDNHRLLVYDLARRSFSEEWGQPGRGRLMFRFPFLMAVTPDGYLLVVETINTRVQVINSRGIFVTFIGSWGVQPGQLFRPKGVAFDNGRVYVSDSYLGRIQVYALSGKFLGLLSDSSGKPLRFDTPTGVAVDSERKRLYVVEMKANQVRGIDLF